MRKIHWRSTAKYRQPMVKQFDRLASHDVAVVLDLFADPTIVDSKLNFDNTRLICETVLSFAATLITNWAGKATGQIVIGIAGDQRVVCSSFGQVEFAATVMRKLAVARPVAATNVERVISDISGVVSKETPCLVFSSRPRPADSRLEATLDPAVRWIYCGGPDFAQVFSDGIDDNHAPRATTPIQTVGRS